MQKNNFLKKKSIFLFKKKVSYINKTFFFTLDNNLGNVKHFPYANKE